MIAPLPGTSFSAVPRRTLMVVSLAGAALTAALMAAMAVDTGWLFAIVFGTTIVIPMVSSGFQRVVIDSTGLVVHKLLFVRVRVAWMDVARVEYPSGKRIWNLPLVHLRNGRVVGLTPLRFSRLSPSTANRVRQAISEIALAHVDYMRNV